MLCVMPPVLITSLKAFHSVKEQPFMCLIIQLIGHYSRGTVRKILTLQQGSLVLLWCWQLSPSLKQCLQYYLFRAVDTEALSNCTSVGLTFFSCNLIPCTLMEFQSMVRAGQIREIGACEKESLTEKYSHLNTLHFYCCHSQWKLKWSNTWWCLFSCVNSSYPTTIVVIIIIILLFYYYYQIQATC